MNTSCGVELWDAGVVLAAGRGQVSALVKVHAELLHNLSLWPNEAHGQQDKVRLEHLL